MKLAVIGSRNLKNIVIDGYIPDEAVEIISGGAEGVDALAAEYAKKKGLRLTVFLPQYEHYGFAAPIVRNKAIVDYADKIIAFWNGNSRGTLSVIKYAKKSGKPCEIVFLSDNL